MSDDSSSKEIEVLLKEYSEVHNHYLFATKQKALLLNILATVVIALVGANFMEYIETKLILVSIPILAALFLFIYGQKETEYWIALLDLERIEERINYLLGNLTICYISKYKRYMFPKPGKKKTSIVTLMQYVRLIPGILLAAYMISALYKYYGIIVTLGETIFVLIGDQRQLYFRVLIAS